MLSLKFQFIVLLLVGLLSLGDATARGNLQPSYEYSPTYGANAPESDSDNPPPKNKDKNNEEESPQRGEPEAPSSGIDVTAPSAMPLTISVPLPVPTSAPIAIPTSTPADLLPTSTRTVAPTSAPTSTPTVALADTLSPAPTSDVVFCPGMPLVQSTVAWWTYSVTLDAPGYMKADADRALVALEDQLQDKLIDLLDCNRDESQTLIGITGLSKLPGDTFQKECETSTSDLPCFVYRGMLSLLMTDEASMEVVVYETRKFIQSLMSITDSFSISTVESIEYLAPELTNPTAVETTNNDGSNSIRSDGEGSSPTISVLAAVGGLVVIIAMSAAYRHRKENHDSPSTVFAGSPGEGDEGSSPRSGGMLPVVYRLIPSFRITTIFEGSNSRDSSDMMVSESISSSPQGDELFVREGLKMAPPDDDEADDEVIFDEEQMSP